MASGRAEVISPIRSPGPPRRRSPRTGHRSAGRPASATSARAAASCRSRATSKPMVVTPATAVTWAGRIRVTRGRTASVGPGGQAGRVGPGDHGDRRARRSARTRPVSWSLTRAASRLLGSDRYRAAGTRRSAAPAAHRAEPEHAASRCRPGHAADIVPLTVAPPRLSPARSVASDRGAAGVSRRVASPRLPGLPAGQLGRQGRWAAGQQTRSITPAAYGRCDDAAGALRAAWSAELGWQAAARAGSVRSRPHPRTVGCCWPAGGPDADAEFRSAGTGIAPRDLEAAPVSATS